MTVMMWKKEKRNRPSVKKESKRKMSRIEKTVDYLCIYHMIGYSIDTRT